jgi:hypothetical protein
MSAFSANTSRIEVLESGKIVTLISRTDDKFKIPLEYIECSDLIVESLNLCDTDLNPEIFLPNMSNPTLELLVQFMKEYRIEPFNTLPKPLPENGIEDCVRSYFRDLCFNLEMVSNNLKKQSKSEIEGDREDESEDEGERNGDKSTIVELLVASNYLRIQPLKQLCTAYLAQILKKKNFTELKKEFKCDDLVFDYKKMEDLHKQHDWCFQKKSNTSSSGGGGF